MNLKDQVDQACQIAEEFVKTYYENVDRRRSNMNKMYSDNTVLIWNGNGIHSADKIQQFFNDLPATEHKIYSVNSQPLQNATKVEMSISINVCGIVNYYKQEPKPFFQAFILIGQRTKWKIASDSLRLLDPITHPPPQTETIH